MKKCTIRTRGIKYLSFSLCEGCGSSLPPRRALVYFQWYGFQASNHIIKALHHIYSSSKVSDNLQLFSTPTAKPCTNMDTLGSIVIIWCILSSPWFIFIRVITHIIYWYILAGLINKVQFSFVHRFYATISMLDLTTNMQSKIHVKIEKNNNNNFVYTV